MTGFRKLAPDHKIKEWLAAGHTHAEIAVLSERATGCPVTRAAVASAVSRMNLEPRRPTYGDVIPWTIPGQHRRENAYKMLRLFARRRHGNPMSEREARDLGNWLARLEELGAVVAYCPDGAPGFLYVAADEVDDRPDGIPIRPRPVSTDEIVFQSKAG